MYSQLILPQETCNTIIYLKENCGMNYSSFHSKDGKDNFYFTVDDELNLNFNDLYRVNLKDHTHPKISHVTIQGSGAKPKIEFHDIVNNIQKCVGEYQRRISKHLTSFQELF